MGEFRVLIIDDDDRWRANVREALAALCEGMVVVEAGSEGEALEHSFEDFDLAIGDLALLGPPGEIHNSDISGVALLRRIHSIFREHGGALIALTGYRRHNSEIFRLSQDGIVHAVIEKSEFADINFAAIAREAVRQARLMRAINVPTLATKLTVNLDDGSMSSAWTGPGRGADEWRSYGNFTWRDLAEETDALNDYFEVGDPDNKWREIANNVGRSLYDRLTANGTVLRHLGEARSNAGKSMRLWLHFGGTAEYVGAPFELLHNGNEYLCLKHVIARRIRFSDQLTSKRPFPEFINDLCKNRDTLRILIVAANRNGDYPVPGADEEALILGNRIRRDLRELDLPHRVDTIPSSEASNSNVSRSLRRGGYHIFHYCGHGHFDSNLPERSGLDLGRSGEIDILTANALGLLTGDTNLQLVFLSCCLGARSALAVGRGESHGVLEALAKADVPVVLAYRWMVTDQTATRMASSFYGNLWRTFSPPEALLEARRICAKETERDDPVWASPILMMQRS